MNAVKNKGRRMKQKEVVMFDNLKDIIWAANPKNRIWPQNRDPCIKGPQPRILSFEAALEMRRRQREAQKNGEDGPAAVFRED